MIEHYFFPEAGTISGIPGTFAGVQVEVDTETNEIVKVSPLARHPHFQASREPELPASEQDEAEQPPTEVLQSSLASESVLPEQAAEPASQAPPAEIVQPEQTEVPPADEAGSHTESEN